MGKLDILVGKSSEAGDSGWISVRKYGLWFETLQFFCSLQCVQLVLIYFVAGRSSTTPNYIVYVYTVEPGNIETSATKFSV